MGDRLVRVNLPAEPRHEGPSWVVLDATRAWGRDAAWRMLMAAAYNPPIVDSLSPFPGSAPIGRTVAVSLALMAIAAFPPRISADPVAPTVPVSAPAELTSAREGMGPGTAGDAAPSSILVSRQLLQAGHLAVGDAIVLSTDTTEAHGRRFRIAGVFEPTPDPMRLTTKRLEARLHLPDLMALSGNPADPMARESVASINVALADPADAHRFADDLTARLPGLVPTVIGDAPGPDSPFVVLERFHAAIAIVTVLGSTAFLLALMVMRADERRESAGVLRLLGFSRRRILGVVLWEGLLIAAVGALFGVLFAASLQSVVNAFFRWKYDTALTFVRITVPIAARCVAFAVPLGVLAGLVASWSILRRDIGALIRR